MITILRGRRSLWKKGGLKVSKPGLPTRTKKTRGETPPYESTLRRNVRTVAVMYRGLVLAVLPEAQKRKRRGIAGRLSAVRVGITCFNCRKTEYDLNFMCPGCGHSAEAGVNEGARLERCDECGYYREASDHDVDLPCYARQAAIS